ncbi:MULTISPECIES: MarR family winged helix-turn-helix transcriptional regulator [unclassified Nocardioides]|uniref:MarR family winged helix-turn-helix transcriptional regulator n=1 Tax=unclassified Nocardioides TaxID=2615069 RepID=UPI0009F0C7F7|nr:MULTISPECIES: MarR family transcriptional regulator [unclassified Nocardioides]GAW51487.1 Transcriptional regulator, Mar family [Nocardioides sp. PD653-B2]GAW54079.1 Transcriptional regulator, Mar family [Nocardioides sp. PD653]
MHTHDDSTSDLLMTAARSMRRSFGEAMAAWDITPSQARALRIVGELGAVRLSVLADRLRIAPRSVTEVVDALEARSLVARQPDPADRRATSVVPTAEGVRLGTALEEARRTATEQRLAVLSDADRAELDRILRLLVAQE